MDRKYTSSLLYAMIFYVFILIYGFLGFIMPVIQFGLFFNYIELALPVTMIILLPLILFLLYFFKHIQLIERHEFAMRLIIIISVVISAVVVFLSAFDIS
ncbi:MAG: hypothetical protein NT129_06050 [Candidatus Aenigmarchaeota archaeon]|nr:hypothetical protein [Candidatus Aenigmarchaeota archaeon]